MAAIILAGGQAKRMDGQNKAYLIINKETIIARQIRMLRGTNEEIIIASNSRGKFRNLKETRIVADIRPGQGPLAGIFTGLLKSPDNYNFIIACDMPFINIKLIDYMYKNAFGYDLAIPRVNNKYEPLYGVYAKSCLKQIENMLDRNILRISSLLSLSKIREITEQEIRQFGNYKDIFANINTREDLAKIRNRGCC